MKDSRKVYFIMCAILGLSVVAAGAGVYFGNSFLKSKSKKIVDLKLETQKLEKQLSQLGKAKKDVEKYSPYNALSEQIVPKDKDEIRAIREIYQIAQESGVKISSISLPVSTLGQQAATPQPASGASAPKATTSISQATPVEGISGVQQLKLVITPVALQYDYNQFLGFLERLEKNRRTAQIGKISISRTGTNERPAVSFSLEVSIYLRPDSGVKK